MLTLAHCREERPLRIEAGPAVLSGILCLPECPRGVAGVVIMAFSTAGSRNSPRNRYMARMLREVGFATLLLDLLAEGEVEMACDVVALAGRLRAAAERLQRCREVGHLMPCSLAAGTAATAALLLCAAGGPLRALVCLSGRPDLIGDALPRVAVPVLLIAGEQEGALLPVQRRALQRLCCERRLDIVPGATGRFKEPGAAETVARLARRWFLVHGPGGLAAPLSAQAG
jgi:pimeloyl-ACP methyl ester carboxylesterase